MIFSKKMKRVVENDYLWLFNVLHDYRLYVKSLRETGQRSTYVIAILRERERQSERQGDEQNDEPTAAAGT